MFCRQAAAVVLKILATALVVASIGRHTSPALATAMPVSQDRLIQVEAGASDVSGVDSPGPVSLLAPDFNPFDALVSQMAQAGPASAAASSHQRSRIDPLELTAAADLQTEGATAEPLSSGATGLAYTRYNVSFDLMETHSFRLTGDMSGSLLGEVQGRIDGRILFERAGGPTIADQLLPGGNAAITIDVAGMLQPGTYRLLVELSLGGVVSGEAMGGASFTGGAQHNLRLLLAELATFAGDYNDNGVVDAADYVVWRENVGQAATLPNDLTPGTVAEDDYDVWQANFGAIAGPGLGNAIPEPATWFMFASSFFSGPLFAIRRSLWQASGHEATTAAVQSAEKISRQMDRLGSLQQPERC